VGSSHVCSLRRFTANTIKGFAQCAVLLNMEFERVFYKNDFAAGAALLNLYMICTFNSRPNSL
jgi:hypothetical protein